MSEKKLIVEPFSGGHRLSHVKSLIDEVNKMDDGRQYVFALSKKLIEEIHLNVVVEIFQKNRVEFVEIPETLVKKIRPNNKDIIGGLRLIMFAESVSLEMGCESIHFLHLDTVMIALSLRLMFGSRISFTGMYMGPNEHYKDMFGNELSLKENIFAKVKKIIIRRLIKSKSIKFIHVFDEFVPSLYSDCMGKEKMVVVPDFCPVPSISKNVPYLEEWLKRKNRFSLFGALEERKGIIEVLNAVELLEPNFAQNASLVLMGKVDPRLKDFVHRKLQKLQGAGSGLEVVLVDRFVEDAEIRWLCENSTGILMPYRRHQGSSGVLCWAARFNLPVLSQRFGLIGQEVTRHKLGLTVECSNVSSLCMALHLLPDWSVSNSSQAWAKERTEKGFASKTLSFL